MAPVVSSPELCGNIVRSSGEFANVGSHLELFHKKQKKKLGTMAAAMDVGLTASPSPGSAVVAVEEEKRSGSWKPLREHDYIGLVSDFLPSSSSCFLHGVMRQQGGEKVDVGDPELLSLKLGATELRLGPAPPKILDSCGRVAAAEAAAAEGAGRSGGGSSSAAELVEQGGTADESLSLDIGLQLPPPKRGNNNASADAAAENKIFHRSSSEEASKMEENKLQPQCSQQQTPPPPAPPQQQCHQETVPFSNSSRTWLEPKQCEGVIQQQADAAADRTRAKQEESEQPDTTTTANYSQQPEPPRYSLAENMLADLHRSGIVQEFMDRKHMLSMRQAAAAGGQNHGHFWLGHHHHLHVAHSSSSSAAAAAAAAAVASPQAEEPMAGALRNVGAGAKRGFSEVIGNSLVPESRSAPAPYPSDGSSRNGCVEGGSLGPSYPTDGSRNGFVENGSLGPSYPTDGSSKNGFDGSRNGFVDGGSSLGDSSVVVAAANSGRSGGAEISQQQQQQKKHHLGVPPPPPPPSAMYPPSSCNPKPSPSPPPPPPSWQQSAEQSAGAFGAFHSQQQQQQTAWDSSQLKKLQEAAAAAGAAASSEIIMGKHPSPDTGLAPVKDAAVPAAAPPAPRQPQVIGWPPVRNFRRQQPPRPAAPPEPATSLNPPVRSPPKPPAMAGTPSHTCLLVKVYMDGRPIGRKVNLTIHNSYDRLKSAVEDMFQQYIRQPGGPQSSDTGGHKKLNLLHSSEYVLTYTDHENDFMLVGDVPWEDFTTVVRRLRITKGDDIARRGGEMQ